MWIPLGDSDINCTSSSPSVGNLEYFTLALCLNHNYNYVFFYRKVFFSYPWLDLRDTSPCCMVNVPQPRNTHKALQIQGGFVIYFCVGCSSWKFTKCMKKNAVGELIEAEFPHPRAGARHGVPAVSLGNGSSGLASAPANPPPYLCPRSKCF